MDRDGQTAPKLALEQVSADRDEVLGSWTVRWRIENACTGLIELVAVQLPHGQFKAMERRFDPVIELPPRSKTEFDTSVKCDEPAGLVTENAFVILSVRWRGEPWRIFVRLRVFVAASGKPETATELITTQRVGSLG